MKRRKFIAGAGALAAGAAGIVHAPAVIAQQKYRWRRVSEAAYHQFVAV